MAKEIFGGITTALALAAAAAAAPAMADSVSVTGSRYSYEQECHGNGKDVYVVNWSGYGLAMYVYQNGRLVVAKSATRTITENSSRLTLIAYAAGSPLNGGANLRVRERDEQFPQLEGSAHLTMRGSNDLLQCD